MLMVASHCNNRTCYMAELDEKYVNVIIRRMLLLDESLRVVCDNEEVTEKFMKYFYILINNTAANSPDILKIIEYKPGTKFWISTNISYSILSGIAL